MNKIITDLLLNEWFNYFIDAIKGHSVAIFTLHRVIENNLTKSIPLEIVLMVIEEFKNRGCTFVHVDDALEISKKRMKGRYVCITVDDGYSDQSDLLLPEIVNLGANPTLFIITNLIEHGELPWDAKIAAMYNRLKNSEGAIKRIAKSIGRSDISKDTNSLKRELINYLRLAKASFREQYCAELYELGNTFTYPPNHSYEQFTPTCWETLQKLERRGVRIGSHSVTHQPLSTMSVEQVIHELETSKEQISRHLANQSNIFCYPIGAKCDFNETTKKLVQRAGYEGAVTTLPGYLRANVDPFSIPRLTFPRNTFQAIRDVTWFEKLRD